MRFIVGGTIGILVFLVIVSLGIAPAVAVHAPSNSITVNAILWGGIGGAVWCARAWTAPIVMKLGRRKPDPAPATIGKD